MKAKIPQYSINIGAIYNELLNLGPSLNPGNIINKFNGWHILAAVISGVIIGVVIARLTEKEKG